MLSGMGVSGRIVMGTAVKLESEQLSELDKYLERTEEDIILITPELTVQDVIKFDRYPVVGFVTETGGFNSHLAILARRMELTAVLSVPGCMDFVTDGDYLILDGIEGNLVVNPRRITIENYQKMIQKLCEDDNRIRSLAGKDTVTKDGFQVCLMGNIDNESDAGKVCENGGEGVGLFRTENLYTVRESLPTEEEQFDIYRKIAEKMDGKPITIRTLDAGGDHPISYLEMEQEENPFLGCRGIRYSFRRSDIFKTQCRAILRASAYGKFRILLPMLSSLAELRRARTIIALIREELDQQKIVYDRELPVGVMIETPAAVWLADHFAKEADFLSIGTNDLTQYTIAADRGNKQIAKLYSHYHPAVLRSIEHVVKCCRKENTPVSICGEAAGDSRLLPLLFLYGVDELSVSPTAILQTRQQIRSLDLRQYRGILASMNNLSTIEETESCLDTFSATI